MLVAIGIMIEIVGFIILVKYAKIPKIRDLKHWMEKNEPDYGDPGSVLQNFPNAYVFFVFSNWNVPETQRIISEFLDNWERFEKMAIILILIGLGLQLLYVLNSNT